MGEQVNANRVHFFNLDVMVDFDEFPPKIYAQVIAPVYTMGGNLYIGEFGEIKGFQICNQEIEVLIEVEEPSYKQVWAKPVSLVVLQNEYPEWQNFYW
jgi:hypothetical protein